jgi:ABC-2 type transport system ATP-binding protein
MQPGKRTIGVPSDFPVQADNLVKTFGKARAVNGVSLAVPQGMIYGVLGPNGAGKTTTLRMLLGIIDPDSGTRSLLGHSKPRDASDRVGYLPEERGLYPNMTARDAIAFMGALRGSRLENRADTRRRDDGGRRAGPCGHAQDQADVQRAWRNWCNCSARLSINPS